MWSTALARLRSVWNLLSGLKQAVRAPAAIRRVNQRAIATRSLGERRPQLEWLEDRKVLSVGYHGGAVIPNVAVETLYYGQAWTQNASLQNDETYLNGFFSYITNSSYMDLLGEYSTSQQTIGGGQWTGDVNVPADLGGVVSDRQIQRMISSELASGALPPANANQLIVVFTAPNTVVSMGGQSSASTPGFYGYHNSFFNAYGQQIRYAVIANPIGNDQMPGFSALDQLTAVSSHELAEAVTDPDGDAWFDGNRYSPTYGYEIGDLAEGDIAYLDNYAVQAEWSNQLNGAAFPAGATSAPTSTGGGSTGGGSTGGGSGGGTTNGMPGNLGSLAQSLATSYFAEENIVTDAYQQYLNRTPDAAGLSFWTTGLDNGMTDEQLDAALIGSQEYINDHGGSTTAWVESMYHDLLGRSPDAAGLAFWTQQLAGGASPASVALGFATSYERESIEVNDDYFTLLGRNPSASEIRFWVDQLQHGVRNEDILAGFVGSAEYFQAANKGAGDRTTWLKSAYEDLLGRAPSEQEISTWLSLMQ